VEDEKYYREQIEPLLNRPLIEYIGEVTEEEKDEFLGNANALLFPIDWPEPFGLVMIIESISRKECRQVLEERFSATRMAQNYVEIYQRLVNDSWMTDATTNSYLLQRTMSQRTSHKEN
jgi:glycosyltransferase involved in cell wall biosynthesis